MKNDAHPPRLLVSQVVFRGTEPLIDGSHAAKTLSHPEVSQMPSSQTPCTRALVDRINLMLRDMQHSETNVATGRRIPTAPARLPSVPRFQAMSKTDRAFALMVHIASLALIIKMLSSGRYTPEGRDTDRRTQLRNARQRLRRAFLHAEKTDLWIDGRWQIGSLMSLPDRAARHNSDL